MGGWAEMNLPRLSDEELAAFSVLLDCENPDLFKWLTGQEQPPALLLANPAFVQLRLHVARSLEKSAREGALSGVRALGLRSRTAGTRAKLGTEWVRGWSDTGLGVPSSGNQQ